MRRIPPRFALVAAAAGVIGLAPLALAAPANENGSNQGQPPQQASEQSANQQSQQAPEGWVLVDEQVITLTANEPQNHFLRAHEYLGANDPKAAAAEVRIAAAYLDMQASRKGNADQQELRSESQHLRQFADQVAQNARAQEKTEPQKSGQQPSNNAQTDEQKQLSREFARAEQVLARHFQQEAAHEIDHKRPIAAGHDLDAAIAAITASYAWSGEKCSKECSQAISDARRLSDEMLSPAPAGQPESARNQTQKEEAKGAEPNSEAQPAAARISGTLAQNGTETNRVPADASKVADELGKAIGNAASENSAVKAGNETVTPRENPGEGPQHKPTK